MRVVFFGTPPFASETLLYLFENKIDVCAVVSRPDKPKGRSGTPSPTPVKMIAEEKQIPVYQPESSANSSFIEALSAFNADLFVVVAYGEILPTSVLNLPKYGSINVHASLLPKYRGAAPIQQAIIHGETETGVTIMHMVRKMDAGDIIKQAIIPIGPKTTYGELEKQLCSLGSETLLEVIQEIVAETAQRTPQDESKVSYAKKIELEDCEIDWNQPAVVLDRMIRGVNPLPGAWCRLSVRDQNKRLKIFEAESLEHLQGTPGKILVYGKEGWVIGTGKGALRLIRIQLEGKKVISADEFTKGLQQDNICFEISANNR